MQWILECLLILINVPSLVSENDPIQMNMNVWRFGELNGCFDFFRFRLKYFDNFLALDEFLGGLLCFPLFLNDMQWLVLAFVYFFIFLLLRVLVSWTLAVSGD